MKKYITLSIIGALVISACTLGFLHTGRADAGTSSKYGEQAKHDEIEAMQKKIDEQKALKEAYRDLPEVKANREKVQKMLDASWEDIKESYPVDESRYVRINITDTDNLSDEGKEMLADQDIARLVHEFTGAMPIGTTEPVVLASRDKQELIYASKDTADGTNIIFKAVKNGGDWEKTETQIQGKVIGME